MEISGVLVVNKPRGLTSHDVVARVRRKLRTRRVGHTGTLDPEATGVLVLCIGEATRLVEYLVSDSKEYSGVVKFGIGTDTDDAAGTVLQRVPTEHLTEQDIRAASEQLVGRQLQRVPRYSAVHINGKRAHELARAGASFETPVREVEVSDLRIDWLELGNPVSAGFHVACSKGTYIRSLCRDWGEKLNVPAHLSLLHRTRSGQFSDGQTVSLDEFEASGAPERLLLSPLCAVGGLEHVQVSDDQANLLSYGQVVPCSHSVRVTSQIAAATCKGELVAVVEAKVQGEHTMLRPVKVFWKRGHADEGRPDHTG